MDSRTRVLSVLNGIIPDRVPKGDFMYHPKTVDEALGLKIKNNYGFEESNLYHEEMTLEKFEKELKFRKLIKCDLTDIPPVSYHEIIKENDSYRTVKDIFGNRIEYLGNSSRSVHPIKAPEDMGKYIHPDINNYNYKNIELWKRNSDLCILTQIDSANFGVWFNLTGFENYMMWFYLYKNQMLDLMKRHVQYNIELAKKCIDSGSDVILIADDFAYNLGTFLKPQDMKDYYFPMLKWQVKEIKKYRDIPIILHSDGDLTDVMDFIVGTGVDGVQALQSFSGMDIKFIKEKYGKEITLMGNIDICELLQFKDPEEVEAVVKETIRIAGPGGRFILSTANTPNLQSIPTENILAMYEAGEKYGKYPIDYEINTELYRNYIKKQAKDSMQ